MPFDGVTEVAIPGWTQDYLDEARAALFRVCEAAPDRVPVLLEAVRKGQVDGSLYVGAVSLCRCITGWLLLVELEDYFSETDVFDAQRHLLRSDQIEAFVNPKSTLHPGPGIRPGDTPATNPVSALVERWLCEWEACSNTGNRP